MSRFKRGASWCAILTTFAAFSVLLLWGMAGVGTAANISEAVSEIEQSGVVEPGEGSFVVVDAEGSLLDRLSGKKAVCWVTNAQLQVIEARWRTTVSEDDGHRVATVHAPQVSVNEMRSYVSGTELHCVLVHKRQMFFLPIEGGIS